MRKSSRSRSRGSRDDEFTVIRPTKQPRFTPPIGERGEDEEDERRESEGIEEDVDEMDDSVATTKNGLRSASRLPSNNNKGASGTLRGLVLCVTGMDEEEKSSLRAEIEKRDGRWCDVFDGSCVTHLLADRVGSAKYAAAVEHEIPIVTRAFASACLTSNRLVDFREFALPCFSGLHISLSGFHNEHRAQLRETIEKYGGIYDGSMTMGRTTHLVTAHASGEKFKFANEWGLPVVNEGWLSKCVDLGAWVKETSFLITTRSDETAPPTASSSSSHGTTTPPPVPSALVATINNNNNHKPLSLSAVVETHPKPVGSPSGLPPPPALPSSSYSIRRISSSSSLWDLPLNTTTTTTTTDAIAPAVVPAPEETATRRLEEDNKRMTKERRPHAALRDCVLYIESPPPHELSEEASARLRYLRTSALHCDAQILWDYDANAVTHVVVGLDSQTPDSERLKDIRARGGGPVLVRPQFVVECALKGRMLSHARFLWTPPPPPSLLSSRPRSGSASIFASNNGNSVGGVPPLVPITPAFTNIRGKLVCVSRYVEPERSEVQRLCQALGARFTDRFTRKDPIVELLVSKDHAGPKFEAAMKWGTPVATLDYLRGLAASSSSSDFLVVVGKGEDARGRRVLK